MFFTKCLMFFGMCTYCEFFDKYAVRVWIYVYVLLLFVRRNISVCFAKGQIFVTLHPNIF